MLVQGSQAGSHLRVPLAQLAGGSFHWPVILRFSSCSQPDVKGAEGMHNKQAGDYLSRPFSCSQVLGHSLHPGSQGLRCDPPRAPAAAAPLLPGPQQSPAGAADWPRRCEPRTGWEVSPQTPPLLVFLAAAAARMCLLQTLGRWTAQLAGPRCQIQQAGRAPHAQLAACGVPPAAAAVALRRQSGRCCGAVHASVLLVLPQERA